MYVLPSASVRRAPCALCTKNGSPPTEPNARTGEFTPPGMTRCARSNNSLMMLGSTPRFPPPDPARRPCRRAFGARCSRSRTVVSRVQALGNLAREVREDDVGAGAFDREQVLQRDCRTVEP